MKYVIRELTSFSFAYSKLGLHGGVPRTGICEMNVVHLVANILSSRLIC